MWEVRDSVSVRPANEAAVRVTAVDRDLAYDLRWYDESASIVPLWWLGIWERGSDELVRTEILQGPRAHSPRDLFDWLAGAAPGPLAAHRVAAVAGVVVGAPLPAT